MSREANDADPERRKKVGNYILGACLGEGSFAKMRIGTHIISREKVAVKIVSKRAIIRRDSARRNFRREALLLQHVSHPNIVRLFEAMETPNSYYLVMELADNGHLLSYLTERQRLEESESRHFVRQIASAVDHLHRSEIVHRDLKLENCRLTNNWEIKLVDFGLSSLCQRESALHTQCGSPLYAAPEIFANRRYGPAVDLWSLGVCLYAMVVGRLPFMPDPPTNLTLLHTMILKGAVIPTFLSAGLQHVLSGLLEVQESRRTSVTDLLHQPWITCNGNQPLVRFPPVSKAQPPSVDTSVVRYMTTIFRFSETEVIQSVLERKLNASSAAYHLLRRHMEARKSAAGGVGVGDSRTVSRDSRATETSEVFPQDPDHDRMESRAGGSSSVSVAKYLRQPGNYKECLLYLKEARNGYYLGRPIASGVHKVVDAFSASAEKVAVSTPRKLPVLAAQRHLQTTTYSLSSYLQVGNSLHLPASSTEQNADGSARPCLYQMPNPGVRLKVMGRPALNRGANAEARTLAPPKGRDVPEKGQGSRDVVMRSLVNFRRHAVEVDKPYANAAAAGAAAAKDSLHTSHVTFSSVEAATKAAPPPPVPPNTAQGARVFQDHHQSSLQQEGETESCPGSAGRDSSLRDPFDRDTAWRTAFKHDVRLGEEEDARNRKSGNVTYVAPLSSPKALTSREENAAAKKQGCFLFRQYSTENGRKRCMSPASMIVAAASNNNNNNTNYNNNNGVLPGPPSTDIIDDSDSDVDNNVGDQGDGEGGKFSRPSTAGGPYAESLDTERFLTPVIRVTITSATKQ